MVERPLPGKTLVGYQDKRKKLLTTLLRQKAVSRNRQGGNGFFCCQCAYYYSAHEVVKWMLLAVCICAQAKNDPSQTNINRAATNTNFFIIHLLLGCYILLLSLSACLLLVACCFVLNYNVK